MKHGNGLPDWIRKSSSAVLLLLAGTIYAQSEKASSPAGSQSEAMAATLQQLQEQVRELRAAVAEVRSEAAQYRAETGELRRELQATRDQLQSTRAGQPGLQPTGVATVQSETTSAGQPQSLAQRVS